jgi:hypothetical protein
VDQLLERYLDQFDGAASTLTLYRGYIRNAPLGSSSMLPRVRPAATPDDRVTNPG